MERSASALAKLAIIVGIVSLAVNLGGRIWTAPDGVVLRISLYVLIASLLALLYLLLLTANR